MPSTISLPVCLPLHGTPRRPDRQTLGPAVAEVADVLGIPLLPWQRHVVDVALELRPDGRPAYRQVTLSVPRQSGKSTLLLALIMHRLIAWGPAKVAYTAQSGSDARKKFEQDYLPRVQSSPFASLCRARLTNGQEQIVVQRTGSRMLVVPPTATAVHGQTLDLAIIDEAFSLDDDTVEQAMKPTQATRRNAQFWVVSTAGTPDSTYLWSKIERGRALAHDTDCGSALFEWAAGDDVDVDDEATWPTFMPALGHTIDPEIVRAEKSTMPRSEWLRAFTNRWTSQGSDPVIPAAAWSSCLDPGSQAGDRMVWALDVAPDRSSAAVAVASIRADGLAHVEVVDHGQGTGWLVGRAVELHSRWGGAVVLDTAGPAGSLVHDLAAHGVPLSPVAPADVTRACGWLFDQVLAGRVRHLGQRPLDVALDGAVRLTSGDAWRWSRRSSSVDISPLVAVTLALWGLGTCEPVVPFFAY